MLYLLDTPLNFIESTALFTEGGAILAVVLVTNTVRHALNWFRRWFPLILSILLSSMIYFADTSNEELTDATPIIAQKRSLLDDWIVPGFLILLNGALIYSASFGLQNNVVTDDVDGFDRQGQELHVLRSDNELLKQVHPEIVKQSEDQVRQTFTMKW